MNPFKNLLDNHVTPPGTHMTGSGAFKFLREQAGTLPVGDFLITPTGYVYVVEERPNGARDVRLVAVPTDGVGLVTREAKFNVVLAREKAQVTKLKRLLFIGVFVEALYTVALWTLLFHG